MPVRAYTKEIAKRYKMSGQTEMSYRSDLEHLLQALCPKLLVTQEPEANQFGRPDFLIAHPSGQTLGYIETKRIGDPDLEGKRSKGGNKEQFDRYKDALHNIIFTDYLHFILYRNGEPVMQARVGELLGKSIRPRPEGVAELEQLLHHFALYQGEPITHTEKLAKIMASKARLMADVIERVLADDLRCQEQAEAQGIYAPKGALLQQLEAFRLSLISDLDAKGFADIYAQTIAYGLFAARFNDPSVGNFSRAEAAELIPKSNPFLRRLFNHIAGPDIEERILWVVEELVDIFRLCDVQKIVTAFDRSVWSEDPIIHFYEDFLAEFDKATRKDRGVWYTPQPVVSFMVRAVDSLLQSHFALPSGLADNSKVMVPQHPNAHSKKKPAPRPYHRVQILDPATGTGTFLAEIVRQMYRKFRGQEGLWPQYVAEHLLPRLHGFELLMASYAMAHLKLDMVLHETGFRLSSAQQQQRLGIYLTNTLEEAAPESGSLFSSWLSDEANQANLVKRDTPVMVIIGNPPYSGESANKGAWIAQLMEAYKMEPGGTEKLKERNSKWLNDDYVKFIRYAEQMVVRNGSGILAYINPHGYLDNPTFRGMRWHLLRTFDEIYVLDLHGNARKKEVAPNGKPDQNVFNIMQGVSVNLFVKTGAKAPTQLGKVYHTELWGSRSEKFSWLESHLFSKELYTELSPSAPHYFFLPKSAEGKEEYLSGFGIAELMKVNNVGIVTARDNFIVSHSREQLERRIEDFFELSPEQLKSQYNLRENKSWSILQTKLETKYNSNFFVRCNYRPFDTRWVYYDPAFIERPRFDVMRHFVAGENVGLCLSKQVKAFSTYQHVFITDKIIESSYISNKTSEITSVFPLYLYPEEGGLLSDSGRVPNLDEGIVKQIAERIGRRFVPEPTGEEGTFAPIHLLDYIYGVLHQQEYRERYFEFLKVDFPRIPYPTSAEEFAELASLGRELRELHLLTSPQLQQPITNFRIAGNNVVERYHRSADGSVWINDNQYFANVPPEAWNYYIGGYQPAQKWLKDRKGEALTLHDLQHYQRLITALYRTYTLLHPSE